ncbi:probable RNA-binding protein EIF1AD [Anoplophora glabripennis]|uniref:probable RNA-binding protein EIF1AD n=1 Tax=Anoplophora glabripennis TaxID=217634 RepID=UPI00087512F9|nr:probable RNA-binding protein EIF1AD [Anoplophora glabripennis]
MPKRFRGGVWVKKGDFVLVEPIEEGNKVKAEIVKILSTDQIKYYKMNNVWPGEFCVDTDDKKKHEGDSDDGLFVNPNRPTFSDSGSSDSDSSIDSEGEDCDKRVASRCSDSGSVTEEKRNK